MKLTILYWLALSAQMAFSALNITEEHAIKVLKNYLVTYPRDATNYSDFVTCGFVGTNKFKTRDLGAWFVSKDSVPKLIINGPYLDNPLNTPIPGMYFIFAEDFIDLQHTINWLKRATFWRSTKRMILIICTEIRSKEILASEMVYIWTQNILNFFVLCVYAGTLKIFTYNPFLETKIIDFSNATHLPSQFPDKLKNLQKYELEVKLYHDPPKVTKHFSGLWTGRDVEILLLMASALNASMHILEISPRDILNNSALVSDCDFCFVTRFETIEELLGDSKVDFCYPSEMAGLFIVTPKSRKIPQYKNIISIFQLDVWLILIVTIFAAATIIAFTSKHSTSRKRLSGVEAFIYIVSGLLGRNIPHFESNKFLLKVFTLLWIGLALIISSAFQCSLVSVLVTPKFLKEIDSVEELKATNFVIYATDYHASKLPKLLGLDNRIVLVPEFERQRLMIGGSRDKAYVVDQHLAEFIAKVEKTRLHVVKEVLISGYTTYVFAKHSPYISKIQNLLMLYDQYGLPGEIWKPRFKLKAPNLPNELDLFYLQFAFMLLGIGYGLGALVFIYERFQARK